MEKKENTTVEAGIPLSQNDTKAGERTLGTSKIQKGGYFIIPKKVREFLGIHAGDDVILRELDGDPLELFELIKA